jgi:MFS transporter, DHA3 family, multidrug efflux protein
LQVEYTVPTMKTFNKLLGVALIAAATNNFVWFALVFWSYIQTQSVIATSTIGGMFLIANAVSGFLFGSIVDHNKKKHAMLGSSVASLFLYILGFIVYNTQNPEVFTSIQSPMLWVVIIIMLLGSVAGGIYNIAVPTLVTILVPENERDKANGKFGTVMGLAFGITSVGSGLVLGFLGMMWVIIIAIVCTLTAILALSLLSILEKKIIHVGDHAKEGVGKIDIKGTITAIKNVPGLFPLIFFTTFNNLLGGVFMALMDAYGLSLVSVQIWGLIWGVLSFGFIIGGLYISKKGLGDNPLRSLFKINLIMWTICIVMTLQPSIILLVICMALWMPMMPFVEATEQTIFQKVVPPERLGRVFGFAHSVEQSASPLTAFTIGPIAQFIFIPFMTTGKGVELIGSWFGTGPGRGMALVFITAGIVGLIVTFLAMRSKSYALLSARYQK